MAEIFGAVASGAGLISLSVQLLEGSQKLKSFCDTARDASGAVARLSFELETMSLALHQFEQYRQQDIFGSELLSRCITSCEQAVSRILAAVDKIDGVIRRSRLVGRVYMGFKDPEVRGLLEEMEHAKSFLQLAYTEYCQYVITEQCLRPSLINLFRSRTMREHANQAAAFALQRELQIEHSKQLQNTVEAAKVAFLGQVTSSTLLEPAGSIQTQQTSVIKPFATRPIRQKRDRSYRLRLSLPRWFVNCVWELAVHEADGVWTTQIWPVNLRHHDAVVFEYVQSGDVEAVSRLLQSGQLSMRDRMLSVDGVRHWSLVEVFPLRKTA